MVIQQRDLTDMARYAPPYTYAVPVDVSVYDQVFTGKKIVALQSTTAGLVKVDTEDASGVTVPLPAGVEMRIIVTKIYTIGTAAALKSGCVAALGFSA